MKAALNSVYGQQFSSIHLNEHDLLISFLFHKMQALISCEKKKVGAKVT